MLLDPLARLLAQPDPEEYMESGIVIRRDNTILMKISILTKNN